MSELHRKSTLDGLATAIRLSAREVLRLNQLIGSWKDPYMPTMTLEQDLIDEKRKLVSLLERYFKLETEEGAAKYLPFHKLYKEVRSKA